jgi:hypothetical protein
MIGTSFLEDRLYNSYKKMIVMYTDVNTNEDLNYKNEDSKSSKIKCKVVVDDLVTTNNLIDNSKLIIGSIYDSNNYAIYLEKKPFLNIDNSDNVKLKFTKDIDNLHILIFGSILINHKDKLLNLLKQIDINFKLIICGSKIPFTKDFNYLTKLSKLQIIYTENLDFKNPKIKPIFKGLNFKKINPEIKEKINIILNTSFKKKNLIFYSVNNKNKLISLRNLCIDFFDNNNNLKNSVFTTYIEYLDNLSKHKFCICPPSFCIDTHRLYESLIVKTIPICIKNEFTSYLKTLYPIVVLDKWDDLDFNSLNKIYLQANWDNYDSLKLKNILT